MCISLSISCAQPKSHQIEEKIAGTERVRDQGDDYRGIKATNPKINEQKLGELGHTGAGLTVVVYVPDCSLVVAMSRAVNTKQREK
jgi:hypothetical protein